MRTGMRYQVSIIIANEIYIVFDDMLASDGAGGLADDGAAS